MEREKSDIKKTQLATASFKDGRETRAQESRQLLAALKKGKISPRASRKEHSPTNALILVY